MRAAAADATTAAAHSSRHTIDTGPPVMYSCFHEDQGSEAGAGLNLRASWLSGRRVYGPVVFAGSGVVRGAVSGTGAAAPVSSACGRQKLQLAHE
jgi:hypothetical protein